MNRPKLADRIIQHEQQVTNIQNQIREQVEDIRVRTFTAREEILENRSKKIEQVREKLKETTRIIQTKHDVIRNRLNQEAIHREANIRVNRGLEALEKFIQILRETNLEEEMLKKAIQDPIIFSSVESEARKIITSDFFKSIQKQLIMQTEFINIAAHELRTPIMPILVNIELLESEIGSDKEEIKTIIRNAKRLQHLTENILSVSRIESQTLKLNKEIFEINDALSFAIRDGNTQIENNSVNLKHEASKDKMYVEADRDRIMQVVSNLLHNAIKFTSNGTIMITSKRRGDEIIVSVHDNGHGIDPQILPILFSKFATKSYKGTGLGLYICKNIIEAHGGKIWAENNTDKNGAIFSFSLPTY
ncbi:MAG TPA: ATP-binding protein [Nitrosopumilaceae archaeon]|nr:ATP-binding protein [Nitrosopumilaceae archaeon]